MYTPDQYQRAKAQLAQASPESPRYAEVKAKVSEFERYNPDHEQIQQSGLHAENGERLPEESAPAKLPELPPETAGESASQFGSTPNRPPSESAPAEADLSSIVQAPDLMAKRAEARKLLEAPPEYVSKTRSRLGQKALGTLIDPLNGPAVGNYYEPSEHQFETDMGQVLKARGIAPQSDDYKEAYEEYKDRKWKQAYEQAAAEDRPLQRVERLKDSPGWQALGNYLAAQAPDVASAFAKGYAAGGTMHATTTAVGLLDPNAADADREQAERNPIASGLGELVGGIRHGGPLAKITSKVGGAVAKYLPGMAGRIAGSALGGAVAAETDLGARSLANAAGDVMQGRGTESAKDQFTSNLLGTGLIGGGLGALGGAIAEGANAFQKSTVAKYPEVAQLRRGGGDTSLLSGVKPGEAVAGNVEAAREPVFGEAKVPQGSNPTEVAAAKVQQPIAGANAQAHTDLKARLAAEKEAAFAADPELAKPRPLRATANAAVDWVLAKLQPEATKKFLPGMRPSAQKVAPAADAQTAAKLADQLWKPRLVTSVEAANEARNAGGRVISVEDAQRLGIDVGGLRPNPSVIAGEPASPSVAEAPEPIAGSTTEDIFGRPAERVSQPKAPKGTGFDTAAKDVGALASETGADDALGTFLNKDRRAVGEAERARTPNATSDKVTDFLHEAQQRGATYDGLVYRGTSEAELEQIRRTGRATHTLSVSKDPEGAQAFGKKGGVVLEIEDHPVPVDGVAGSNTFGEALVPKDEVAQIVSERVENGVRYVRLKMGASADRLAPRPGRAARTPAPEPGSDWDDRGRDKARFDFIFGDSVKSDPFPAPAGNDNPTRVSNSPPIAPPSPPISIGAPSSPPPELRARPTPAASQAQAAGIPAAHMKVVLEPREYDARKLEEIIGDIDQQAKAGKANANPDPQWKVIQKAIREDRNQFGPKWSKLIADHHEQLNAAEQRSARAGLNEAKPYSEMQPNNQQAFDSKLEGFPGNKKSSDALRAIAADASPKVLQELEELGATNAYSKLKNLATPKLTESASIGGAVTRLQGLGPATKLRGDALARRLASGATGEPTIPPGVLDYVRRKVPGRKWLPGNASLGGGALGLKGGVAYNKATEKPQQSATLTPEQIDFLGRLLDAVNSKEATP